MEAEQPLCLPCARLDDLEYLPAGDAALTRRAGGYSERTAVVVRFSRSRGRYERQGVLVKKDCPAPAGVDGRRLVRLLQRSGTFGGDGFRPGGTGRIRE
jgi:hypothetical protein